MCNCKNINVGSFDNKIEIAHPSLRHPICVDACIADEVVHLLHQGVKTIGSCCGHNKTVPSIAVAPECVKRMEELGYKHHLNASVRRGPYSRSYFYAKSVKCSLWIKLTKVWLPYLWRKLIDG